jgi:Tat protein secretion system quality control protein TatD with DNase activity
MARPPGEILIESIVICRRHLLAYGIPVASIPAGLLVLDTDDPYETKGPIRGRMVDRYLIREMRI